MTRTAEDHARLVARLVQGPPAADNGRFCPRCGGAYCAEEDRTRQCGGCSVEDAARGEWSGYLAALDSRCYARRMGDGPAEQLSAALMDSEADRLLARQIAA